MAGISAESISGGRRGGHRAPGQLDRSGVRSRVPGFGPGDPPMLPIGRAPERPDLADVHQRVRHPRAEQPLGDAIGQVALRDAVQRDAHAGLPVLDSGGLDRHPFETDAPECALPRLATRAGRHGRVRRIARGSAVPATVSDDRFRPCGELPGVELPQRLNCGIEYAAGQAVQATAQRQQLHEIERRRVDASLPVESAERRVGAVQAEYRVETAELRFPSPAQACATARVPAVERDIRSHAERGSPPPVHRSPVSRRAGRRGIAGCGYTAGRAGSVRTGPERPDGGAHRGHDPKCLPARQSTDAH